MKISFARLVSNMNSYLWKLFRVRSSYKVRIVFAEMDKNLDVYFIIGTERIEITEQPMLT